MLENSQMFRHLQGVIKSFYEGAETFKDRHELSGIAHDILDQLLDQMETDPDTAFAASLLRRVQNIPKYFGHVQWYGNVKDWLLFGPMIVNFFPVSAINLGIEPFRLREPVVRMMNSWGNGESTVYRLPHAEQIENAGAEHSPNIPTPNHAQVATGMGFQHHKGFCLAFIRDFINDDINEIIRDHYEMWMDHHQEYMYHRRPTSSIVRPRLNNFIPLEWFNGNEWRENPYRFPISNPQYANVLDYLASYQRITKHVEEWGENSNAERRMQHTVSDKAIKWAWNFRKPVSALFGPCSCNIATQLPFEITKGWTPDMGMTIKSPPASIDSLNYLIRNSPQMNRPLIVPPPLTAVPIEKPDEEG